MSGDRLVVGYQEFVSAVSAGLSATDEHSCQEQDGVDYKAMAKVLWASGYRFDPAARRAWLIVELRSKMPAELQSHFAELLQLAGVDDA
ncbi:hypothetical protein SEA_LIZZ_3 [Streptomyces phage Lizz]|jgi:hypothetical protein|nr:hypothetical protein SEA_PHTOWN_3 [Streptomyces phage PHTowN]QNO12820.1 hypothetical protein SEA_SHAKENBAKE_3 [Streptomyces phage ShakeNBake]QYW07550.1 hypothetical protein SEA_LIZZ_3 [Streptomyces phage Lizz]